jgi:hypothetical protein
LLRHWAIKLKFPFLSIGLGKMYQQQIVMLSLRADDHLRNYVAIHNELFEMSIKRLVPIPGFFQSIDFNRLLNDISQVATSVEEMLTELRFLLNRIGGAERDYVAALMVYIEALQETVKLLLNIIDRLKLKNDGERYGWSTYRRDLREYQRSVANYVTFGNYPVDVP